MVNQRRNQQQLALVLDMEERVRHRLLKAVIAMRIPSARQDRLVALEVQEYRDKTVFLVKTANPALMPRTERS